MFTEAEIKTMLKKKNVASTIESIVRKGLKPIDAPDFIVYIMLDNLWLCSGNKQAYNIIKGITTHCYNSEHSERLAVESIELAKKLSYDGALPNNLSNLLYAAHVVGSTPYDQQNVETAVTVAGFIANMNIPRHITAVRERMLQILRDIPVYERSPGARYVAEAENIMKAISTPAFRDEVLEDGLGTGTKKMFLLFKKYNKNREYSNDGFLDFGDSRNMQRRLIAAIPYINACEEATFTMYYEKPYRSGGGVFNVELKGDAILKNIIKTMATLPPDLPMNARDLFYVLKEHCGQEHVIFPFANKVQMSTYFEENWEAITKEVDIELRKPYPTQTGKYYIGCSSRGADDRIICGDTSSTDNNTKEVTR